MVGVGVLGHEADAGGDTGEDQGDGRRRPGRRHLDPAPVPEGHVPVLLEAELADVELHGPVLVGDGNANRSHAGDAGGLAHLLLLGRRAAGRVT
jgi:hypothetical protein